MRIAPYSPAWLTFTIRAIVSASRGVTTRSAEGTACASARHRAPQVLVDLVEEAGGREPLLVGADEEREVFRHEAGFDGVDADGFERSGKARELLVVVELGAVREAARPGEDRGDRVGRGLLALLVLAVVAGHGAVGGPGL